MGLRQWLGLGVVTPPLSPANAVDALCVRFGATYERSISAGGEVQMRLIRPDATLSAVGATTYDAIVALEAKAAAWESLL